MQDKRYSISKNSLFNVLGWIVPILVNFVSIPIIVGKLGYDQYGVWVLVMAIMGYFALLDLGVVKGGIRFLAEYNANNDTKRANEVISLGLYTYALIGLIGGGLIFLLTDPVLIPLIKLPDGLQNLARQVLHLASLGFLVTMMQTYLLSLPQALHRFDISNKVDAWNQVLVTTATVIALFLGFGLKSIILIRIVGSLLCCLKLYNILRKSLPYFRLTTRITQGLPKKVFSYSLLSFVGRIGAMAATQLQIILIGSILGTTAVTLFNIPYQLVSRVMNITCRLSTVMFPIASELNSGEEKLQRLHVLYLTMTKYLFFLSLVQVVMFSLFSWDILSLWIGRDFADQASFILILVAIGYFFNSLTFLPSQICEGLSHLKVTVAFAFITGIVCIIFVLIGGHVAGVTGVACGSMLSFMIMSVSFNIYVHSRVILLPFRTVILRAYAESTLVGLIVTAIFLPFTLLKTTQTIELWSFLLKATCAGMLFLIYGFARILDSERRKQLLGWFALALRKAASTGN